MGQVPEVHTDRLLMRQWRADDRPRFAALNADPDVMEFFPARLSREESDAFVDRIEARFAEHGWGLWAVEVPGVAPFIGFVGLNPMPPGVPCSPAVEVGWRLAKEHWGNGYATEGGIAALGVAFDDFGLSEVVSMTSKLNTRSSNVMHRLGMRRSPADDFDHPSLPAGHRLQPHVLYRIDRQAWSERTAR
jgi:RimJ/RimL family protein N-acetyltransferase